MRWRCPGDLWAGLSHRPYAASDTDPVPADRVPLGRRTTLRRARPRHSGGPPFLRCRASWPVQQGTPIKSKPACTSFDLLRRRAMRHPQIPKPDGRRARLRHYAHVDGVTPVPTTVDYDRRLRAAQPSGPHRLTGRTVRGTRQDVRPGRVWPDPLTSALVMPVSGALTDGRGDAQAAERCVDIMPHGRRTSDSRSERTLAQAQHVAQVGSPVCIGPVGRFHRVRTGRSESSAARWRPRRQRSWIRCILTTAHGSSDHRADYRHRPLHC